MQLSSQIPIKKELLQKIQDVVDRPEVALVEDILGASLEKFVSPQKTIFYFTQNEIVSIKIHKTK